MMIGCIHGRFQPFHNGHFEYLRGAMRQCDRIIIGITQYDRTINDSDSPAHRLDNDENPFSYWERYEIIRSVVHCNRLDLSKINVVPFPINDPPKIRNFVSDDAVMFTTIYDHWNVQKIRRLKSEGFDVRVLWRRKSKLFEGRIVRKALLTDQAEFEKMVPLGVSSKIKELRLAK